MNPASNVTSAFLRRSWLARNRAAFRDTGGERRPRLLVDVSVIMRRDAGTGIQRVVRSVYSQLLKMDHSSFDLAPVRATRSRGYCFAPHAFVSGEGGTSNIPVAVRPGDKFLGLDLAASYLPYHVEQLQAWRSAGASLHLVVYDLLPLNCPEWFDSGTVDHFRRWISVVTEIADQALCISETVAQQLRQRLLAIPSRQRPRIGRLHLSGDIIDSVPSAGVSAEVNAILERVRSRSTILMVGTIEPRKAYDRAIDAFERLWATQPDRAPDLVIVGKGGWKTAALQRRIRNHAEIGRRLHWLESVSDEALSRFYEACRGVFLASHEEGFGLPAVEAATFRRWALVRDLPAFREQHLPNLMYFSDDSPEGISRELLKLVRAAEVDPLPQNLPRWSWCVQRLVEDIGIVGRTMAPRPSSLSAIP